jgi:hypothetical protein
MWREVTQERNHAIVRKIIDAGASLTGLLFDSFCVDAPGLHTSGPCYEAQRRSLLA